MIITYTLDIFFMCIFLYTLYHTETTTNEVVFFEDDYFEYKQPYVIFKTKHVVPLLHSKLSDLKIPSQIRVSFQDDHCEYQQCYVIFKIEYFVPYLCSKSSDLKNSFTNGVVFYQIIILSTNIPYVIFKIECFVPQLCSKWPELKNSFTNRSHFWGQSFWEPPTLCYLWNWTFHPIFLFILILFALCLHKPYFLLFKCNFDSLKWQLGTYYFYVDLETSSKIKLICVPTHYYWSIPFSAVNSIF